MATITIRFGGNFVCRLATNPDPFDELRGRAGWTWAYPGEPDLDRIIHFDPDFAHVRTHTDLSAVSVFDQNHLHPELAGGLVRLGNVQSRQPKFEGRDRLIADPSAEPVVPLQVEFFHAINKTSPILWATYCRELNEYSKISVSRNERWDTSISDPPLLKFARRLFDERYLSMARRSEKLKQDLINAGDTTGVLDARLKYCKAAKHDFGGEYRCQSIHAKTALAANIKSALLNNSVDRQFQDSSWPIELHFFGFDADAMAGCIVGKLDIPSNDWH